MTVFLLTNGADIDARTIGENQAPVHYAAKNGATKSLQVLLGFDADINSLDYKQRTPLQVSSISFISYVEFYHSFRYLRN